MLFIVTIPLFMMNNQNNGALFGDTNMSWHNIFPTFFWVYMTTIGEYGFTGAISSDGFVSSVLTWAFFLFGTVLLQLIMMNLIIAIIKGIYEDVLLRCNAACYMVRCALVVEHMHLISSSTMQAKTQRGDWLIFAQRYDFSE